MWDFGEEKSESSYSEKYAEERDALFQNIEEKKKEIFDIIDNYGGTDVPGNIKDLISEGIQMYVGGHVVNFEISDVKELPSDKLKEDVKNQFQEKLNQIKEAINDKLYSLSESYESLKEKLDDEIEKCKSENVKVEMPEIDYEHAKQGLSVVKGSSPYELIWLYRGKYMVNTVDSRYIELELSRSITTPVIVEIRTYKNDVSSVKLRQWNNLKGFRHYHSTDRGTTDCWGNWEYQQKWDSPEDIIDIGRHALNILKDVNTDSPGESAPPGLPTIDELIASMRRRAESDEAAGITRSGSESRDSSSVERERYVWTVRS